MTIKVEKGSKQSVVLEEPEIDDFVEAYLKHARRFQLFRDHVHKLVALTLVGHATRNWTNKQTAELGNRLFVIVFGETYSGKTRAVVRMPTDTLGSYRKQLNVKVIGSFSTEKLAQMLKKEGPQLMIFSELAGALVKSYSEGAAEFFNHLYDATPFSKETFQNPVELSEEQMRASVLAATTIEQLISLMEEGKVKSEQVIYSGFLPRFVIVTLEPYTEEQEREFMERTESKILPNENIAYFLLWLQSQERTVTYSKEALNYIASEALPLKRSAEDPVLRLLYSRIPVNALKLAANYAIARKRFIVEIEDAEDAIDLLIKTHIQGCEELVDKLLGLPPKYSERNVALASRVYRYIMRKGGVVPKRTIMMNMKIDARKLQEIAQTLEELYGVYPVYVNKKEYLCARNENCEGCEFRSRCSRRLKHRFT